MHTRPPERDSAGAYGTLPVCTTEDHAGDTEALIALYNAWGQPDLENWLSREPISEWEGVSVDVNGRVVTLNLSWDRVNSAKRLTGELPPELGSLESLKVLYLSANNLTGDGKCLPNATLALPTSIMAPLGELCITGGEFASVSAGSQHTCGVMTGGSVACWTWFYDRYGRATPPEGEFASVSAEGGRTYGGEDRRLRRLLGRKLWRGHA